MASLRECEEWYSYADVMDMVELVICKAYNRMKAQEMADKENRRAGV